MQKARPVLRYYFHIRDHAGLIPDEEGSELPGIADARIEARASAMDFAMNDLRSGRIIGDRQIEIASENGTVLESMTVRETVLSHAH